MKTSDAAILGAISGANHVHTMAKAYGIPVILHTDHAAKKLLPWIDGLLDAGKEHFAKTGRPLFTSHMLDLSEESLEENIEICVEYFKKMNAIDMMIEIELGITGGEEDGVDNSRFIFMSNIQKQRIEQIWIIIINNALDELVKIEDYENRELKIDILEEKNTILVRFKDNAGGLSKEILKKLFEPFTSSKNQGGMGIGLSIAKKIVEEHNGSIKAYNEDNGALFEVRLKKIKEDKV